MKNQHTNADHPEAVYLDFWSEIWYYECDMRNTQRTEDAYDLRTDQAG